MRVDRGPPPYWEGREAHGGHGPRAQGRTNANLRRWDCTRRLEAPEYAIFQRSSDAEFDCAESTSGLWPTHMALAMGRRGGTS